MKILIIHNAYKTDNIGGEDLVFLNEVNALKESLGEEYVYYYKVENDDASSLDIILNIFYSIKHYFKIFHLVSSNEIRLVHVHNFFPLLSTSIFRAAKDAGASTVLTLHNYRLWCISGILFRDSKGVCHDCLKCRLSGVYHRCYRNSFSQSLVATIAFYTYSLLRYDRHINRYFVLTDFQKMKVIEFGLDKDKVLVKPNFINPIIEEINKSKEGFIYVGRLESSKGIVHLIDVWKTLGENYKLSIVGSGPLKDFIESLKQPNIRYYGKLSNQETLTLIGNSKYLLQTSLWYETFGLTIIEAFSAGTPVIGYKIGTRTNFIIDGFNGFICNVEELRDTLIKANEYAKYKELSENSIHSFQQFSKQLVISKQIGYYREITNMQIK